MAWTVCDAWKPPRPLGTVRARQKKLLPSGILDNCVRMRPGVRNAAWMFQRGQAPEKRAKRMPEALKHWREAARLAPQWPEPLNNLAWVLATDTRDPFRAGAEAVELASRAVALAGTNNARVLDTLAAAYAEAGRVEQASATARQAVAAATAQGQSELVGQLRRRLELYKSNGPYRQPASAR